MCRGPLAPGLVDARYPSDIAHDVAAGAAIAARHPEEYEAALDKEHTTETAIRDKLIEDIPLVIYPGSAPSSPDGSPVTHIRVHRGNLKLSLYFTDPIAQSTIKRVLESPSPLIGVMYSRDCNGQRQGFHGFVATAVRAQAAKHGAICVRLHTQHEFSIVGTVRREPDGAMAGSIRVHDLSSYIRVSRSPTSPRNVSAPPTDRVRMSIRSAWPAALAVLSKGRRQRTPSPAALRV